MWGWVQYELGDILCDEQMNAILTVFATHNTECNDE